MKKKLLILAGDGIGPEVMNEVKKIIVWFNKKKFADFEITEELAGGISFDKLGEPITDKVMKIALESDAVLLGAVGGPKWDKLEFSKKPERALLRLRKDLELFANLRPAICFKELANASTLKPEVVSDLDIKVVKRPESLAEDTSNVVTAVQHAYNELREDYDIIILLQPTAPFRTAKDLDAIVQIFEDDESVENVVSVVPMDDIHPARMYNMNFNKELTPFIPNTETLRRQDLVPVYYRNGCFYAIRTSAFFRENSFMISNKNAYVMDPNWLVNIDSIRDFKLATVLYEDWKNEIADY